MTIHRSCASCRPSSRRPDVPDEASCSSEKPDVPPNPLNQTRQPKPVVPSQTCRGPVEPDAPAETSSAETWRPVRPVVPDAPAEPVDVPVVPVNSSRTVPEEMKSWRLAVAGAANTNLVEAEVDVVEPEVACSCAVDQCRLWSLAQLSPHRVSSGGATWFGTPRAPLSSAGRRRPVEKPRPDACAAPSGATLMMIMIVSPVCGGGEQGQVRPVRFAARHEEVVRAAESNEFQLSLD